jgi:phospholipase D1/2
MALTLDSEHTQQHLQGMHPNINVLRHPGNLLPILWSHHEKMVVIDQEIGFMGGLDLCYGRMDNKHHKLFDIRMDVTAEVSLVNEEFFPGLIKYLNVY